ncbi:MAG: hypothetical protein M5U15_04515 [Kiritimatiellae bacterium]|nr:hypothetical protein [Kiritimatiellia bacterium]
MTLDPDPQVPVGEKVQPQQRHEVGEVPAAFGFELQILDQEYGDQCCPNLDMHRVGGGADEGLDAEILLEVA